jgi:type II secretory pathway pseudopilin PulG
MSKKGFTLVEFLIYTAVFTISAGLLVGILTTTTRIFTQESAGVEVASELNFAMQTIQRLVGESSAIIVNNDGNNDNDATPIGQPYNYLVLRMKDSAGGSTDRDPIVIWKDVATQSIKMQQGRPPNQTTASITTEKVLTDTLTFKKITSYPGHDTVQIEIILTYNTTAPGGAVSRTLKSAIGRVSAATFDSGLIPGITNTYDIGTSGTGWRNAYLTGVLNLGTFSADPTGQNGSIYYNTTDNVFRGYQAGSWSNLGGVGWAATSTNIYNTNTGNIGIGTTSPTYKLDVAGTFRATATSIFSDNVGIGTTAPDHKLDVRGNIMMGAAEFGSFTTVADTIYLGHSNKFLSNTTGVVVDDSTDWINLLTHPYSKGIILGTSGTSGTTPHDTVNARMVIQSGGNVGIGTTGPITQLHIPGKVPSAATGSAITGAGPYSVYVQGRYAYMANSDANTLQIFDVSNPASPVSIGSVATGAAPHSVYVQGRYAYVVNRDGNTLQIFDVSNPATPINVGWTGDAMTSPYSIYVQGKFAYVVGYSLDHGRFGIIDVSNPTQPRGVIGSEIVFTAGINPRSIYVQGRYVYIVNSGANTLQIIDVSNPALPVSVGSMTTETVPYSVYVQGRYAYVVNYSANTLQIIDVSNPALPTSVGSVATGLNPYSVYVQGRYAYVVNLSSSTLQIFDVSNTALPTSVGSVATNNYPYSVYIQGRYAYVVNTSLTSTLQIFDVGGSYIQQLEAGGIETGTLSVRNNLQVNNDLDVRGGLQVARGIGTTGPFSVFGGATGSTFVVNRDGNVGIGTSTPAQKLTVAGTIESTTGGFKFPDGTQQTTAVVPAYYTSGVVDPPILDGTQKDMMTVSFTLSKPSLVYAWYSMTGGQGSDGRTWCGMHLDDGDQNESGWVENDLNEIYTISGSTAWANVSAGSHHVDIKCNKSGTSHDPWRAKLDVISF